MAKLLSEKQIAAYAKAGYVSPVRVFSADAAAAFRGKLEALEAAKGGTLSGTLRFKPHLLHPFLADIVYDTKVLDAVEDIIGPNILAWSSAFFIKEPRDGGFVSWHQDSTYWGLSAPNVVSAWVALTPSTPANGCMRTLPGTHTREQMNHTDTHAVDNMLSRGQVVDAPIDQTAAVDIELQPGEMSLHHVRLVHGSAANTSNDRRIGFSIRYIPPEVHQTDRAWDSASLVRGTDSFGHFEHEPRPSSDGDPAALAWHAKATEIHG